MKPMFAAAAILLAGISMAHAQDVKPAPIDTPHAPENLTVNPMATLDVTPKHANLLTGMYATKAVIEICNVTVDAGILKRMSEDQAGLETSLQMDAATSAKAYEQVKADVTKTKPDCADGSADRKNVDAVVDIYSAGPGGVAPAAAAAPTAATPVEAVPTPAAPVTAAPAAN